MKNISFGSVKSLQDKRTIISDKSSSGKLPIRGEVKLDFKYVNDLCHQLRIGICTACATRMAAEEYFRDKKRLDEWWLYLMGKVLVDSLSYSVMFEGSSALTMLKTAYKYGIPEQKFCKKYPLKINGSYDDFIKHFNEKYNGQIPAAILDNAAKHKIGGYKFVNVDPESLATEIYAGKVLICRLDVGDNWYKPSWKASDLLPLRRPTKIDSGHLVAMNSYDGLDKFQILGGPNSWGTTWADKGFYRFVFDTQKKYFTEAWIVEDIPQKIVKDIQKEEFKINLEFGMKHPDVKRLQIWLNNNGYIVSKVGAGSKGEETDFYGSKTQQAVGKFQSDYGIVDAGGFGYGFFGPRTRATLNRL